jgi:hypothetical protein
MGLKPAWSFTAGIALPALASLADAVAHVPSACIGVHLRLQFLACFLACRTRPQGRPAAALMPEPHAPVRTAASHRTAGHTGAAGIAPGEAEPLAPVHALADRPRGTASGAAMATEPHAPAQLRHYVANATKDRHPRESGDPCGLGDAQKWLNHLGFRQHSTSSPRKRGPKLPGSPLSRG